jgi:hypothetical protein
MERANLQRRPACPSAARFVLSQDYDALDERYGESLQAYKHLQLELSSLEQRLDTMRSSEAVLVASQVSNWRGRRVGRRHCAHLLYRGPKRVHRS